jgi:hypothetical protein
LFVCSCPGKAITEGDKIVRTFAHNHMADPGTVAGKKAQCDVINKASQNPKVTTSLLVEEFAAKTDDPSFRTRTITVKSLQRQIQRAKAKASFKPAAPKSFDDLETIPEEFKVELCDIPDCKLATIYVRFGSIFSFKPATFGENF